MRPRRLVADDVLARPEADDDMPAHLAAAFAWFAAHVMVRELGGGARDSALAAGRRCLDAGQPCEAARWDAIVAAIDRIAVAQRSVLPGRSTRGTASPLFSGLA